MMGLIYIDKGEDRMAIHSFKVSLNGWYNGKPSIDNVPRGRPDAAAMLNDLYEKIGEYDSALYYRYLMDTVLDKLDRWGWGEEAESGQAAIILSLAKLNLKANRPNEAEKVLLSMYLFRWQKNDDTLLAQLKAVLTNNEKPAALKSLFAIAVDHYTLDTVVKTYVENKDTIVYCCLQFLGAKVRYALRGIYLDRQIFNAGWRNSDFNENSPEMAGLSEKERITANLKKSQLYRLIQGL